MSGEFKSKLFGKGKLVRPKAQNLPASGSFIALGKPPAGAQAASAEQSIKPKQPIGAQALSSSTGIKREGSAALLSALGLPKKPRLDGIEGSTTASVIVSNLARKDLSKDESWLKSAAEIKDATNFLHSVDKLSEDGNANAVVSMLCGVAKIWHENRTKSPDPLLALAIGILSKTKSHYFQKAPVLNAFCCLLQRSHLLKIGMKPHSALLLLVANVLNNAFADEDDWPFLLVKTYLDDSLGERFWVDRTECQEFCRNIATAFKSKTVPADVMPLLAVAEAPSTSFIEGLYPTTAATTPTTAAGSRSPNPALVASDETSRNVEMAEDSGSATAAVARSDETVGGSGVFSGRPAAARCRFEAQLDAVQTYATDLLKEVWAKQRTPDSVSKALLQTTIACAGFAEVRQVAAQRLDACLQTAKLQRIASQLLLAVCHNCSMQDALDAETIVQLTKLRLKSQLVIKAFSAALKLLFAASADSLGFVLRTAVLNELSPTSRSPHNMLLVQQCFLVDAADASQQLASTFRSLLVGKEDYLRSLRTLLREIIKTGLRYDFPFCQFTQALMQPQDELYALDLKIRDRLFHATIDLVVMCVLASASPGVREAASGTTKGQSDSRNMPALRQFQANVAITLRDAVKWLQLVVPKLVREMINNSPLEYVKAFYAVLLLDKSEVYAGKDGWPGEAERNFLLKLSTEGPLLEETLIAVFEAGLDESLPLSSADAIELAELLVKRAAAVASDGNATLHLTDVLVIDYIFNSVTYRVNVPAGYQPPLFAVQQSYWKGVLVLLILAAHNPALIGRLIWDKYPTLKCFMVMLMTSDFNFPPFTFASSAQKASEIKSNDLQVAVLEKQQILDLETVLNSGRALITEATSVLLPLLIRLDPKGLPRRPPPAFLSALKSLNKQLNLGFMLCKSRKPDFLLDIINVQGAAQSLPWLVELIDSNEGCVDILPVQCLCEFFLHFVETGQTNPAFSQHEPAAVATGDPLSRRPKPAKETQLSKTKKGEDLKQKLRLLCWDANMDIDAVQHVLAYFFTRLQAKTREGRKTAISALRILFGQTPEPIILVEPSEAAISVADVFMITFDWLFRYFPLIPLFAELKDGVCGILKDACLVETDAFTVAAYLQFLAAFGLDGVDGFIVDLAKMVLQRENLIERLLPLKARDQTNEGDAWQHDALAVLQKLFLTALERTWRQSEGEDFAWTSSEDQLQLRWPIGKQAILQVQVAHASLQLLTFAQPEPSVGAAEAALNFEDLMDIWYPEGAELRPSAYLTDTLEEAELFPNWLKLRMLCAPSPRVVQTALDQIRADGLAAAMLYVTAFGIPIPVMNSILEMLDAAVGHSELADQIRLLSKAELLQLRSFLRAHYARSRENGKAFLLLICGEAEKALCQIQSTGVQLKTDKVSFASHFPTPMSSSQTDGSSFDDVFTTAFDALMKGETLSIADERISWRNILSQLTEEVCGTDQAMSKVKTVIHSLKKAHWKAELFSANNMEQLKFTLIPLLKLLDVVPLGDAAATLREIRAVMVRADSRFESWSPSISKTTTSCSGDKAFRAKCLQESGFPEELKRKILSCVSDEPSAMQPGQAAVVQEVVAWLRQQPQHSNASQDAKEYADRFSAAFDALLLLDPEALVFTQDAELEALFGDRFDGNKLLLSFIPHGVKLSTLSVIVSKLLTAFKPDLCVSSVLQFVTSCMRHPRLFRGRSSANHSEHQQQEDVLGLSESQLCVLLDFIIADVKLHGRADTTKETATLAAAEPTSTRFQGNLKIAQAKQNSWAAVVKKRVVLALACCHDNSAHLTAAVKFLANKLDSKQEDRSVPRIAGLLLLELYLHRPQIVHWLPKPALLGLLDSVVQIGHTKYDAILGGLFRDLIVLSNELQTTERIDNVNAILRGIATNFPAIVCRQLPSVCVALQAIVSRPMAKLRFSNHLMLLAYVLDLVELLQPACFQPVSADAFLQLMSAYLSFTQSHGLRNPRFIALVEKTLVLLKNFHGAFPEQAAKYLEGCGSLFQAISFRYPQLPTLRTLLAQVSLPLPPIIPSSSAEAKSTSVRDFDRDAGPVFIRPPSPVCQRDVQSILVRLRQNNDQEIHQALLDLDRLSMQKPDALLCCRSELMGLMAHPTAAKRELTFELVLRLCRFRPTIANEFVQTFLRCFSHPISDVGLSALKFLKDYAVLLGRNEDKKLLFEHLLASCSSWLTSDDLRIAADALASLQFNSEVSAT